MATPPPSSTTLLLHYQKVCGGFGWTFHNHEYVGYKMIRRLFRRLKLPLDERQRYVAKLVRLHMRPAQLADEE